MQNAFDAIRIQQLIDQQDGSAQTSGKVTIHWDNQERLLIVSPKDAVKDVLQNIGATFDGDSGHLDKSKLRIEEKEIDGVTLAYALEWSEFFNVWSFLMASSDRLKESKSFLGTCVGGVRVDVNTPGFDGIGVIAIANAEGVNAPKTNVVRSCLEATPERDAMLRSIYSQYCDHVKTEMEELYEKRQFSLTWATQEAKYLLMLLSFSFYKKRDFQPLNTSLFIEMARKLPVLVVEKDNQRQAITPEEFSHEPLFWTIDCALFRSAELIIREVASPNSLSNLIRILHADNVQLPINPILCGFNTYNPIDISVFEGMEVDKIGVFPEQRRVDLRWVAKKDPPRCRSIPDELRYRPVEDPYEFLLNKREMLKSNLIICHDGVEVSGVSDEIAVRTFNTIYLLPNSQIVKYLISCLDRFRSARNDENGMKVYFITVIIFEIFDGGVQISNIENILHRFEQGQLDEYRRLKKLREPLKIRDIIDPIELNDIIEGTNWKIFDPSAWVRKDQF